VATKQLPDHPNITHLKNQAKDLKKHVARGDSEALDRVAAVRGEHPEGRFTLRDAQFVIAREYGYDGWHSLNTDVGERMVAERDLHRWFGVQLNNGTWNAIDAGEIGPDSPVLEREAVLYGAYAAAYHWRQVPEPATSARGEHLIARTAILTGFYDLARSHASRCLELLEASPDEAEDWDWGFAHEAIARAAAALGDATTAQEHHATASRLGATIADEVDRTIFLDELARGPWFDVISG
jgi:hypothetical protein